MRLTPMRYKGYVWPNNPESYRISFHREVAVHKLPYGRCAMQDLGMSWRVLEGEGAFAGEGAYDEFKKLATVFYDEGAGVLVHPVWMTTRAYFVELELTQEPTPDYVRYRFVFWETTEQSEGLVGTAGAAESTARYHTSQGESLWAIAAQYGTTASALAALNPGIRDMNAVAAGERVRVG